MTVKVTRESAGRYTVTTATREWTVLRNEQLPTYRQWVGYALPLVIDGEATLRETLAAIAAIDARESLQNGSIA